MGGLRATRLLRDHTWRLVGSRCVRFPSLFRGLWPFLGVPAVTGADFRDRSVSLDIELVGYGWCSRKTPVSRPYVVRSRMPVLLS